MKFMILAYETPDDFARRNDPSDWDAYIAPWSAFASTLTIHAGAALEAPETATRLSIRNGRRIVEDGPFADTKEQLGGYFVVEAPSLDAATELARQCPTAKRGRVEVRFVPNYAEG